MNTRTLISLFALTTTLVGCISADGSTEDVESNIDSVGQAFRVNDPALACGTPDPDLGEDLNTSGAGAELQEWTDTLNAMPASATKTDLLNRLLTNVQGPASAFADAASSRRPPSPGGASHRTGQVLFTSGSSGQQVITPAAGRFTTSVTPMRA